MDSRQIRFNPSQREAISHGEGPVLVLSGAGSGKTGVITHRVARLIDSGVKPERILCLTFTRKAAKEMMTRITNLTPHTSLKNCFIGTFHAWGLIFMKKHAEHLFPTKQFTLYDENDRKEALLSVFKEFDIDYSGNLLRFYSEQISLAKNNLQAVSETPEAIQKIYQGYTTFLANRKACDFDDLLLFPCHTLSAHPELLEKYQNRYDYILVDEYQDTNRVQYQLLRYLAEKKQNIMAVGDDDQSIYSWRGARIENILDFEKDFPHTRIIRLETNYRSSENIIACANSLITNNIQRKEKKLIPSHSPGDKLHVYEAKDPYAEAQWVADTIKTRVFKDDCGYGEFAILYRAKHQSKIIKDILSQARIPFQAFGEIDFFNRKEIRDLMALAKLLLNPHDDISMLRVINIPRRIREVTLKKLLELSAPRQQSLYDFLKEIGELPEERDWLKAQEWEKLSVFVHFLESYRDLRGKETPERFQEFLHQVEYRESLLGENDTQRERREKNIEQFLEIMKSFFNKNTRSGLDSFITWITMDREEEEDNSMVSLLTIHAAKGLEFPHVFIIGFEENLIPFSKEGYPTSEEEERRLCYVALTRAQKTCSLTFCKKRKVQGGEVNNPPSRFLKEISAHHLIKEYGENPEKPPPASEEENEKLRRKAFEKMKSLLQD